MSRFLFSPKRVALLALLAALAACAHERVAESAHEVGGESLMESCTSIMAGRLATVDGSVITSHTCDANYRTWMQISRGGTHEKGSKAKIYKGRMHTEFPSDTRKLTVMGEVPQVAETASFIDTAYPAMNEHQLAMGESTFNGLRKMRSKKGIFQIEELQRLALERTRTARDAIQLIGALVAEYGYADGGEALTIADPKEVWHFEILGPGQGNFGGVWAAVRIPDDHVGVAANICRISQIDLYDPDHYMASKNVFSLAEEMGLWSKESGEPFKFWKAYGGTKRAFTSREYWIFKTLAPSLDIDFDKAEELPFSVKPERKVSVRDIFAFFRGTYEGTRFELCKNLLVENRSSKKQVQSSYVHPWMGREQRRLFNTVKPGAIEYHRPVPVMYNAYNTVIQCRSWLPDPIGGLCWIGYDNPGTTPRAPVFCGVLDLPKDFKVDNQHRFRRDSAAWAFRRASRLACIRWGEHKGLMQKKIMEFEERAMAELPAVEKKALELHAQDPAKAREFLTSYCTAFCRAMTHEYWELGDQLWYAYRFNL